MVISAGHRVLFSASSIRYLPLRTVHGSATSVLSLMHNHRGTEGHVHAVGHHCIALARVEV